MPEYIKIDKEIEIFPGERVNILIFMLNKGWNVALKNIFINERIFAYRNKKMLLLK